MPRSKQLIPKTIPLSGKLITAEDPAVIGENFQTLKNLRYASGHVKGVGGMTKINASVAYVKPQSGFHFRKDSPPESHLLVEMLGLERLLLHMDGADGSVVFANSSTSFTHVVTPIGNAQIDTAQSKFGGASALFAASGDYLTTPNHPDFDLSGGIWTIDFWIRPTSLGITTSILFEQSTSASDYMSIDVDSAGQVELAIVAGSISQIPFLETTSSPVSINLWHHIEVVENGDNFYIFVNGVLEAFASSTGRPEKYTGQVGIGHSFSLADPTKDYTGWIDEFRLVKGVAVHTSSFTPPTTAHTSAEFSAVLDNKAVPPALGIFEALPLHTDVIGVETGRFSDCPGGNVAYCNGKEAMIWGGDEKRINRFINADPSGISSKEMTDQVTNTLTDASNVAVIASIPDITVWTAQTSAADNSWRSVTWAPAISLFCAVATSGINNRVMTSPDGINWTIRVSAADNIWSYIAWSPSLSLFCAVAASGVGNRVMTSPDGINWTIRTSAADRNWTEVAWSPSLSLFCAVAGDVGTLAKVMTSPDGINWTIRTAAADNAWTGLAWSPSLSLFCAVGSSGAGNRVMTSPDGINWTIRVSPLDTSWVSIAWSPSLSLFCAVAILTGTSLGQVMTSPDGANWTIRTAAADNAWTSVAWSPLLDLFCAVSTSGVGNRVMTSPDGVNWVPRVSAADNSWNSVAWAPSLGLFCAVAVSGVGNRVMTSQEDRLHLNFGTTRTAKGFKIHIKTPNTISGTTIFEEWNGSAWVAVSSLVDGTALAGKPLAQTGLISFTSTDLTAKTQSIDSVVLYWYRLVIFEGISVGTSISQITAEVAFQTVKDIWDGQLRKELSFHAFTDATFNDNTVNVFLDIFDSANSATFSELDGLKTASESIIQSFSDRLMGLEFHFVGGSVNNTLSTLLFVDYWDGSAWVALATSDGTREGGAAFAKSGVVTWNPPAITSEFKRTISKGAPLYAYRVRFDKTLSGTGTPPSIKLFYVAGIPAQKTIKGFSFPMTADNRLWLLDEVSDERNAAIVSAESAPDVWNGEDSTRFRFGNETKLMAGAWIYQQIGSDIRSIKIFTKQNETWVVDGLNASSWVKYRISDSIGCVAPLTMKTINLGDDPLQQVAIWQGSRGIYLCDGRTIVSIHADIRQFFDDRVGCSINLTKSKDSVGVFDSEHMEYHWLFADGSSTTLNREFVYDILKKQWFEIVRGAGKELQFAFNAQDAEGNDFVYGTIDTGFLERLENGNDFDGTAIVHELQTGDMSFEGIMHETQIEKVKLVMVSKAVTGNSVAMTHYGDSNSVGTPIDVMSPVSTGRRIADVLKSHRLGGHIMHSLKATMTTTNEATGFEPLAIGLFYKDVKEDLG